MHDADAIRFLSQYDPKPISRIRGAKLLAAAQATFNIGDDIVRGQRLADLRPLIRRINETAGSQCPTIIAGIAESALILDYDPFSQSIVRSFANGTELPVAANGAFGRRLYDCIGERPECPTIIRDVCRLLNVHTHFLEPEQYLTDLRPFLGNDYLAGFQQLSKSLDLVTLNMLVCRWWKAQRRTFQTVQAHVLGKYLASGNGRQFWSDPYPVARSAILNVMVQSLSPAETIFDLAEQIGIVPQDAPDNHSQFFAACYLWHILERRPMSPRHTAVKRRIIRPHEHLRSLLTDVPGLNYQNKDFRGPVSLATTMWCIAEAFGGDRKGSIHDVYSHLYGDSANSVANDVLPALRVIQPRLWGLWHTQKTTWAHHLEMTDDTQTKPFADEMDELFETSGLMQASGKIVAETVLAAIRENQSPELIQAANLIAGRFLSRKFRNRQGHNPADDDTSMLELAEELTGIKDKPDHELGRLLRNGVMKCDPSILMLAALCNLIVGNESRASAIYDTLFALFRSLPNWIDLYAGTLLALRERGKLGRLRANFRHVTDSTAWIHDESLASLDSRCHLAGLCMEAFVDEAPGWVERAAQALSTELSKNFRRNDSHQDRFYNLHNTTPFRHLVPRALRHVARDNDEKNRSLLVDAILWDIAFANRSLLDRRRFWRSSSSDHTAPPPPGDDCKSVLGPAAWATAYTSAASVGMGAVLSLKDSTLHRADEREKGQHDTRSAAQFKGTTVSRSAAVADGDSVDSGLAIEASVATALGRDTVLVKLGFTLDGRLVWSAFRANGTKLDLLGSDCGSGSAGANRDLTSFVHDFDSACDNILKRGEVLAAIHDAQPKSGSSGYDELLNECGGNDANYFAELFESLLKHERQIKAKNGDGWRTVPTLDSGTVKALSNRFGTPEDWRNGTRHIPSLEEWQKFWGTVGCREDLNTATEEFLTRAASVIPVNEIGKLIAGQDVALMLEDSLFAIPFSFLRNSERKRMFEMARSIRTILSPAVHESYWRDESQPASGRREDQVLCISGVAGQLPDEMVATRRLFQRHAESAANLTRPLKWRGAWDWPRGSHHVMARGIHDVEQAGSRTALLTVLGHGHRDGGVELRSVSDNGAEYWQAHCIQQASPGSSNGDSDAIRPACDLRSVDFLIQVSCSVGRAEQDGLYDVQGFPANLVVAGARSTAAARWPILADEAERFANHLAACYLRRRDDAIRDGVSFRSACIRGLAMADVRKWWLESHHALQTPAEELFVGLHTAAAFELYGFG